MRLTLIGLLLALPALAHADQFQRDVVYKCIKDGQVTFQEMPCGWSALGSDEQKNAMQYAIPFSDFCKDRTISNKNALKRECPHFTLPKDRE